MTKYLPYLLLLAATACASPSTPGELAAAGPANASTREGTLPTEATQVTLPDGSKGWSVACNLGRNFDACETRAKFLCSAGYTIAGRDMKRPANSSGVAIATSTGTNPSVTGITSLDNEWNRTLWVKCTA